MGSWFFVVDTIGLDLKGVGELSTVSTRVSEVRVMIGFGFGFGVMGPRTFLDFGVDTAMTM